MVLVKSLLKYSMASKNTEKPCSMTWHTKYNVAQKLNECIHEGVINLRRVGDVVHLGFLNRENCTVALKV